MQRRKRLKSYNGIFSDRAVIMYVPKPYSVFDRVYFFITTQKANECVLSVLSFFLFTSLYAGNKN